MIDLEELWRVLDDEATPPGSGSLLRRLPVSGYDVYLTQSRPQRQPGFLVRTNQSPGNLWKDLRSSRGLGISIDPRPGQPVTLQLTEADIRFHDVFAALVGDLLRGLLTVAELPTGEHPALVDFLVARITRWQTCLKANTDGLSGEKRAGLFGELSTLLVLLDAGASALTVVDRWTGPEGAVQDFQFDTFALEIKASRQTQPTNVRISSERQLDTTGLERLFLIHFGLDERSDESGVSLPALVGQVRAAVSHDAHAALLFDVRLLEYGYLDLHAARYADSSYVVRGVDYFNVLEGMPRIVEADLPVGVGKVAYDLSLAACEPFRVRADQAAGSFATLKP